MKKLYIVLALFVGLAAVGCDRSLYGDDFVDIPEQKEMSWRDRLQSIMDNPPQVLAESGIRLLGYEMVDNIDSDRELEKYTRAIQSDENMIPDYGSDTIRAGYKINAVTKSDLIETRGDDSADFLKLDEYIAGKLQVGMDIVRLMWDNNGVKTSTLCAVSDTEGIVYDNLLSNTFVVTETVKSSFDKTSAPARVKAEGNEFSLEGDVSWEIMYHVRSLTNNGTINCFAYFGHSSTVTEWRYEDRPWEVGKISFGIHNYWGSADIDHPHTAYGWTEEVDKKSIRYEFNFEIELAYNLFAQYSNSGSHSFDEDKMRNGEIEYKDIPITFYH